MYNDDCLDGGVYGWLEDLFYISALECIENEDKKKEYIKRLWRKDPVKYGVWKQWCMEEGELSDIFGTIDNPIDIDESKL